MRAMIRTITINTDASFDSATGAAGFAIWITTTERRIHHSGKFKSIMLSSAEAERAAIINAMHLIINELSGDYDQVVINTDCMDAIHHFTKRHKKNVSSNSVDFHQHAFGKYITTIRNNLSVKKIKFTHVKGHSANDKPRNYVNNWCDKQAKKQMREHRKQITQNTLSQ